MVRSSIIRRRFESFIQNFKKAYGQFKNNNSFLFFGMFGAKFFKKFKLDVFSLHYFSSLNLPNITKKPFPSIVSMINHSYRNVTENCADKETNYRGNKESKYFESSQKQSRSVLLETKVVYESRMPLLSTDTKCLFKTNRKPTRNFLMFTTDK